MAPHKPTTLSECFVWLSHNLTAKQLADVRSLTREELWQMHFWLSPIIKRSLLEDNVALHARLECSAFCDDPDMAGQIGIAFWDHLQITDAQTRSE